MNTEGITRDILRLVRDVRQHQLNCPNHQANKSEPEDLKERIDQALWNLRKFESTKYTEYFSTAIDILEEVKKS